VIVKIVKEVTCGRVHPRISRPQIPAGQGSVAVIGINETPPC
jgi:hypothetical protein